MGEWLVRRNFKPRSSFNSESEDDVIGTLTFHENRYEFRPAKNVVFTINEMEYVAFIEMPMGAYAVVNGTLSFLNATAAQKRGTHVFFIRSHESEMALSPAYSAMMHNNPVSIIKI
jgi:hypothetical protein